MPSFGAASSAHSVRVPLSTVPLPQYGNRTVWQDEGLRIQGFAGSVIAADRDAPPGLQVRFGTGDPWIPLGPGEVLWAPRRYEEVHARIYRAGLGVPTQHAATLAIMRPYYPGAVLYALTQLPAKSASVAGYLQSTEFNIYNQPTQPPTAGLGINALPGELFIDAEDLTADVGGSVILGDWFSQFDLSRCSGLEVTLTANPADVLVTDFYDTGVAAFSPFWRMGVLEGAAHYVGGVVAIGASEARTAFGGVGTPGRLMARHFFQGPFAGWQYFNLSDVFGTLGPDMSTANLGGLRGTRGFRLRLSFGSRRRSGATLWGWRPAGPVTHSFSDIVQSLRYQEVDINGLGGAAPLSWTVTASPGTLVGAPALRTWVDPWASGGVFASARVYNSTNFSGTNPILVQGEESSRQGVLAALVVSAGASWDPSTVVRGGITQHLWESAP